MTDSEVLNKLAEHLSQAHPYFNHAGLSWVAGWLRHGSCCVYCKKDLISDWETLAGLADTDHLLPRKYSEIDWNDSNLVLCCKICNGLKKNYDANSDLPEDLRYVPGMPHLTDEQHFAILELCRKHVANKRPEKRERIERAVSCWKNLAPTTCA